MTLSGNVKIAAKILLWIGSIIIFFMLFPPSCSSPEKRLEKLMEGYRMEENFVMTSEELRVLVGNMNGAKPHLVSTSSWRVLGSRGGHSVDVLVVRGSKGQGEVEIETELSSKGDWKITRAFLRKSSDWDEVELTVPK